MAVRARLPMLTSLFVDGCDAMEGKFAVVKVGSSRRARCCSSQRLGSGNASFQISGHRSWPNSDRLVLPFDLDVVPPDSLLANVIIEWFD
jgi:hypothetical protein